jgi:hypothetical protein
MKVPCIVLGTCLAWLSTAAAVADEGAWRPLPLIEDGRVAPGWTQIGWGEFAVDGESLRSDADERGLGLLVWEREKFGNCQIRVVFRLQDARSNSGVYVRIGDGILEWRGKPMIAVEREPDGRLSDAMLEKLKQASEEEQGPWYAVHHGYEIQISDRGDPLHRTGSVYSLARTTYDPPPEADRWRTMIITLADDRVLVDLDGQRVTTFDPTTSDIPPRTQWHEPSREARRPRSGYIGLQTHDPGDVVYFKEISVGPLE